MNSLWSYVNLAAMVVVFIHAACKISIRKWYFNQARLYAYTLITAGSLGSIIDSLTTGGLNHVTTVMLNVGLAIFFLADSFRLHRIKTKKLEMKKLKT